MQKKIIALAIAAAMTAPAAAMAEATVYGQVNMAYEIVDDGGDGTGVGLASNSKNNVSSNVSRLGFKGSEDLGSGLTGVFQMEGQVLVDDAGSQAFVFDRNTFLGVAGGFGTVVMGQHDTPYKMATRGMDVFADSIADNRSLMGNFFGMTTVDARESDVLAYLTPNFGGFTAAVAIVGETDNTLVNPTGAAKVGATTLSAKYGMDNWSAVLGYISLDGKGATSAADFTATGTKVGGSFSMDMFSVNAVYEMLSLKAGTAGDKTEQDNIYVSGTMKVGDAGKVKLAYTMAGEAKSNGTVLKNTDGSQVSVGYDHAMTKNTTLFALYTTVSNGTVNGTGPGPVRSYGLTSGGSTGDTVAGALAAGGVGDPTALAVGVRHSF